MRKKLIRLIGFKELPPEVTFTSKCHHWSIQNCDRPGSDVEFLKLLFEFAEIDYEVIQKEVTTSEEIIDAIENGTIADMSLISLIVSPDRLKKVSFTIPVNYLQFGYTVKEQNVLESDQFLLKTFEVNVYFALTLVVSLVAGFAYFAYRNNTYKQWLWITFASFFNQANHPKSRKTSFLFLTGSYWFTAFLTICFYQARMKYFLTVPLQKGVDFLNMHELLDELRYGKWTVYEADNGYFLSQYCRNDQCRQIEELARKGK
uniref:Solute-binding protein family 3/N-terminal domain-containing protein n=1 Tax=Panagrolaimus davidi TaxID=227884 RepID=A0A914PZ38_9BILA